MGDFLFCVCFWSVGRGCLETNAVINMYESTMQLSTFVLRIFLEMCFTLSMLQYTDDQHRVRRLVHDKKKRQGKDRRRTQSTKTKKQKLSHSLFFKYTPDPSKGYFTS